MVFGGEDVSLEKDILAGEKKFVFTYYEWLRNQGVDMNARAFNDAGIETTVFTVPNKQTLYLTNWSLTVSRHTGGVATGCGLKITSFSDNEIASINIGGSAAAEGEQASTGVFVIPLKIDERERIILNPGPGLRCTVSIQGFLVPKKIT